jgi:hypothetical protein
MTSDTTVVIEEAQLLEAAYDRGYSEFEDADVDPRGEEEASMAAFTESARYTSSVLPDLREWSGYDDTGTGTYGIPQTAFVVPVGNTDDTPAEAVEVESRYVLEEAAVPAYLRGCRDALHGEGYDCETVIYSRM